MRAPRGRASRSGGSGGGRAARSAGDSHVAGRRPNRDATACWPARSSPSRARNRPAEPTRSRRVRPCTRRTTEPARAGSTRPVTIDPSSLARSRGRMRVATWPDSPPTIRAWKTPGLRARRSKTKTPSVPALVCAITVQPARSRWTRNTSESGTVAPVRRTSPSYATTEGCADSVTPSAPHAGAARAIAARAASGTMRRMEAHCATRRTIPPWQPPRKDARPTPGSRSSRSTPRTTSRASSSSSPASTPSPAAPTGHVPRPSVDDPTVRRVRLRRGDEPALPVPARAWPDRSLGRLRPPDAARVRLRRRARPGRGGADRCRDRLDRRHGAALRRHPAERGLDLDDDQRAGGVAAPALRARRGGAGRVGRRPARHRPERRPQGVLRARQLHLPAAADHADHDRPLRVLPRTAAALQHDLDLRATTSGRPARRRCRSLRSRSRTGSPTRRPRSTRGSRPTSSASGSRSSSTRTTTSSRRSRSSARRGGCGRGS